MPNPSEIKSDTNGNKLPKEYECHMRSHLEKSINQKSLEKTLLNKAERKRRDIWWIEVDGSNSIEVAKDIVNSFITKGIEWYNKCGDLESALQLVEQEDDCFVKYVRAAYIAKQGNNLLKYNKFRMLAEEEGKKIGAIPDREKWFAIYS